MKPTNKNKKGGWGGRREGAGRPPKYGEAMVYVAAMLPPELLERLDAWAGQRAISRSEAVLRAVERLVRGGR